MGFYRSPESLDKYLTRFILETREKRQQLFHWASVPCRLEVLERVCSCLLSRGVGMCWGRWVPRGLWQIYLFSTPLFHSNFLSIPLLSPLYLGRWWDGIYPWDMPESQGPAWVWAVEGLSWGRLWRSIADPAPLVPLPGLCVAGPEVGCHPFKTELGGLMGEYLFPLNPVHIKKSDSPTGLGFSSGNCVFSTQT